jgi:GntR family transcriptional regulator
MLRTASASPLPGGQAPLYARLRKVLFDRVTSGEWRPGDQIPTIRALGELYGVSRMTVVQALDELSHEGVLVRWQGKGVFVGQPRPAVPRMPLQSFTEETLGRGHIPSSRTLRFVRLPADLKVRSRLGLRADEGVVFLERLRLMDGYPIAIQRVYLPEQLVPGLLDRQEPIESLYEVLAETYGILPTNALESYAPIRLAGEEARLLQTRPDAAAFHVDRTTSDQHGRTVEFASSVLRGDRYAVHLNLRRQVTEQLAEYQAI